MARNFKKNHYRAPIITSCPLKGMEDKINYKNVSLLEKYISTRGRIMPSTKTGICNKNQRRLARAIKRARQMALLPYTKYV